MPFCCGPGTAGRRDGSGRFARCGGELGGNGSGVHLVVPTDLDVIVGQTRSIKTVDDLRKALASVSLHL